MQEIKVIPIEKIKIPKVRASARMTDEAREFFEETVKRYGVLQPILVRDLGDGNYELLAGKSRLEELKKKGEVVVQAVVVKVEDRDATIMHLVENLGRGQVSPLDVARVLKKARDEGVTVDELAKLTGHSKDWVMLYLLINELPEQYQEALDKGDLKVGHLREAFRLPNPAEAGAALDYAKTLKWDISTTKRYVNDRLHYLGALEAKGESIESVEPPSIEEAEEIVRVQRCTQCGRVVDADTMMTAWACKECLTLLRYVLDSLGDPQKAMHTIYEAITFYSEYKAREERIRTYQYPVTQVPSTQVRREQLATMPYEVPKREVPKKKREITVEDRVKRLEEIVESLTRTIQKSHTTLLKRIEELSSGR